MYSEESSTYNVFSSLLYILTSFKTSISEYCTRVSNIIGFSRMSRSLRVRPSDRRIIEQYVADVETAYRYQQYHIPPVELGVSTHANRLANVFRDEIDESFNFEMSSASSESLNYEFDSGFESEISVDSEGDASNPPYLQQQGFFTQKIASK